MSLEPQPKKARVEVLAQAVKSGDLELLRSLLEDANSTSNPHEWLGAVGDGPDQEGWNMLHLAAMTDQAACIELILKKFPKLAMEPAGVMKVTPLLLAVEKERELNTIKALLKGAGKTAVNYPSEPLTASPLWKAFSVTRPNNYAINLVKLLLANKASLDKTSHLEGAIRGKNVDVVKLMLKLDCEAGSFYADSKKEFPLYTAADIGSLPILKLILKFAPLSVKIATKQFQTALSAACRSGHVDCVEELLAAGANPNHLDAEDHCPLTIAARRGRAEVVKVLLEQEAVRAFASTMNRWRDDIHPILNAILSGSAATLRLLVHSEFLLHDLGSNDQVEMCTELPDNYCIDWDQLSCLSLAINQLLPETEQIVDILVDAGFAVNAGKVPPLSVAVMQMSGSRDTVHPMMERIIRRLLEAGANFEFTTYNSFRTPVKLYCAPDALVLAVQTKSMSAMHLLLKFWDRPPAELLFSYEHHDGVSPLDLQTWFPVLTAYGVPHGHPSMSALDRKLQANKEGINKKRDGMPRERVSKEVIGNFIKQIRTPSLLKQLARFAVREMYGKVATKEKKTLPTVLKDLEHLPNCLMLYLLMEVQ